MALSPNASSRGVNTPSVLVIHYTGMQTAQAAISQLCDPVAKVSAHYVVDEVGEVYALVDEGACAWHAGVSYWRGFRNVNEISIGVEIVNPGHEWGYRPFPHMQMRAVAELCRGIIARHNIPARNVVGHSDVAPQRKADPGELFEWEWLASQGVGVWPFKGLSVPKKILPVLREGASGEEVLWMQTSLASYGYSVPQTSKFDVLTRNVVVAFQRHFRAADVSGIWDGECAMRLEALLQANNTSN